jgi:hypothetical protein
VREKPEAGKMRKGILIALGITLTLAAMFGVLLLMADFYP